MAEESTTPDAPPNVIEIIREWIESTSFDEWAQWCEQLLATDAVTVFDDSWATGLGPFEGLAAWLTWVKDYWAVWDEHHHYADEILDLGSGVVFFVVREDGRMMGSDTYVENRSAWVSQWVAGLVVRATVYTDVEKARAAAERLAEQRG
jgi:ketosteroid isomerase-like protein